MEKSSPVKLFVGNLPLDTSQSDLEALFAPYGEMVACSMLKHYAFVHLLGDGAAERAINDLHGSEFRGRNLVVEEPRSRNPNATKVFVGNLSATSTTEDLQELFQNYGKVLDCVKVQTKFPAGYAFVHMENKEEAMLAIEALHGYMFKGRALSVQLSKAAPSKPLATVPCASCGKTGHFAGECPVSRPLMEHHQSQAAVLAAAAAAAAGLPLQVQQSVHNSFYNTTSFDPTYAALKGLTTSSKDGKPVSPAVYGALASQVYGSVANQVLGSSSQPAEYENPPPAEAAYGTDADPQAIFEAARARFFEQGQQVLAEQQAVTKSDRDRSPVRRSAPLLPDPVPKPFTQARPKRRALLPTPPGGPEDPSAFDGDPISRCYAEYYKHYQQYQQYQPYPYYPYSYMPPPPMPMPPPGPMDAQYPAAPGTVTSPSV
ncbi:RNA-binding protein 14a isoform X2 [Chanos chanos]|nr:RNA-binding protein 4-like isoform X2 [Chanos chanos]